jgi:hypothetical protein
MDDHDSGELDLLGCPSCGAAAQVTERFLLGGLEHVRVRCVRRHWYLMPAACVPGAVLTPVRSDSTSAVLGPTRSPTRSEI